MRGIRMCVVPASPSRPEGSDRRQRMRARKRWARQPGTSAWPPARANPARPTLQGLGRQPMCPSYPSRPSFSLVSVVGIVVTLVSADIGVAGTPGAADIGRYKGDDDADDGNEGERWTRRVRRTHGLPSQTLKRGPGWVCPCRRPCTGTRLACPSLPCAHTLTPV